VIVRSAARAFRPVIAALALAALVVLLVVEAVEDFLLDPPDLHERPWLFTAICLVCAGAALSLVFFGSLPS
jgi:hypothetical protein